MVQVFVRAQESIDGLAREGHAQTFEETAEAASNVQGRQVVLEQVTHNILQVVEGYFRSSGP